MNDLKTIGERVRAIMDSLGETPDIDIRQQVIDLCREVAFLAHQVDAVIVALRGTHEHEHYQDHIDYGSHEAKV